VTDTLRFTLLGCGSSPGTPRPNGDWGACDPANPRNRRMRAAALVERIRENGERTTVVIDTGPDFRAQMLMAGVEHIDAVVYTHPHADHIHGIDDLRTYVINQRRRMPVYADSATLRRLKQGFDYCFETPAGSNYPPILTENLIDHHEILKIDGRGGPITLLPLPQQHGDIVSLGFRIGGLAYCPDISGFFDTTLTLLDKLEWLVIDALQYRTHPSHFSLGEALDWIERLKPKNAILTHMHIPLDYATVESETPAHVHPGYDGMVVEIPYGSI
jgi:phosphoribosyl 1,2-cyclic phosphate phosphodiesterase